MKLKPLFDRVLVKEISQERTTTSGIVLPSTSQERPQIGEVVAIGDGTTYEGKEGKMLVSIGQQVMYNKYTGSEVKLNGKDYLLLKQTDIMAILEEK